MPRFTMHTSNVETAYWATSEAHDKIVSYHAALRSRYGDVEGNQIMFAALQYASANFSQKAKGKPILAYLDRRYRHVVPRPTAQEVIEAAAREGVELVNVSHILAAFREEYRS